MLRCLLIELKPHLNGLKQSLCESKMTWSSMRRSISNTLNESDQKIYSLHCQEKQKKVSLKMHESFNGRNVNIIGPFYLTSA